MKTMLTLDWLICGVVLPITMMLPIFSRGFAAGIDASPAVKLPKPKADGPVSVERALRDRRSIRDYSADSLTLEEVSQLVWAAQGITSSHRFRTAPSAGALYPLEIYVVAGDVENLLAGVYRYVPREHQLLRVMEGDKRSNLADAALRQSCVQKCAAALVIAAVYGRTTQKYGERGIRYVHMEAGHAAQNVNLQAVSLNLGTVVIGAFHDNQVQKVLHLPAAEQPLYIMPLGKRSL